MFVFICGSSHYFSCFYVFIPLLFSFGLTLQLLKIHKDFIIIFLYFTYFTTCCFFFSFTVLQSLVSPLGTPVQLFNTII